MIVNSDSDKINKNLNSSDCGKRVKSTLFTRFPHERQSWQFPQGRIALIKECNVDKVKKIVAVILNKIRDRVGKVGKSPSEPRGGLSGTFPNLAFACCADQGKREPIDIVKQLFCYNAMETPKGENILMATYTLLLALPQK